MIESSVHTASRPAIVHGGLGASLRDIVVLARPHHWSKNIVVLAPLFFSRSLDSASQRWSAWMAFAAFCFASSAVYVFNDLKDAKEDRLHAGKALRPIAAGKVSPMWAIALLCGALTLACLFALRLSLGFQLLLAAYILLNVAYSSGLKRVAILDAMIVAFGFVLRAEAGSAAISVPCTVWLVICTFAAALMVSFGKRRQEFAFSLSFARRHRSVLHQYSQAALDAMLTISAVAALIAYACYCLDGPTAARIGSRNLIVTLPFAMFGIFRFVLMIFADSSGDLTGSILRDRPLILNGLLWLLMLLGLLYLPPYSWPA